MIRILPVAIGLILAVGCSPTGSLCREAARCEGEDPEQCVDEGRDAEEEAEDIGCGGEYRAVVRCIDRHGSCEDGDYVIDMDECSEQIEAQTDCYLDAML